MDIKLFSVRDGKWETLDPPQRLQLTMMAQGFGAPSSALPAKQRLLGIPPCEVERRVDCLGCVWEAFLWFLCNGWCGNVRVTVRVRVLMGEVQYPPVLPEKATLPRHPPHPADGLNQFQTR